MEKACFCPTRGNKKHPSKHSVLPFIHKVHHRTFVQAWFWEESVCQTLLQLLVKEAKQQLVSTWNFCLSSVVCWTLKHREIWLLWMVGSEDLCPRAGAGWSGRQLIPEISRTKISHYLESFLTQESRRVIWIIYHVNLHLCDTRRLDSSLQVSKNPPALKKHLPPTRQYVFLGVPLTLFSVLSASILRHLVLQLALEATWLLRISRNLCLIGGLSISSKKQWGQWIITIKQRFSSYYWYTTEADSLLSFNK